MRRGEPWGTPLGAEEHPPGVAVVGGDEVLAAAAAAHPGALLHFTPTDRSDLARAIGLRPSGGTGSEGDAGDGRTVLPCDALRLDDGTLAVNAVVLGVAPDRLRRWHRAVLVEVLVDGRPLAIADGARAKGRAGDRGGTRATTVVVANGQFLRGSDLVPRGHPGDGRLEVQVYGLRPGERRGIRARLATGTHVPHPRIAQRSGRSVEVRWTGATGRREQAVEVDGVARARARDVMIEVVPGAVRVLG